LNNSVTVIPAQAGIQDRGVGFLDARLREHDAATVYQTTSHGVPRNAICLHMFSFLYCFSAIVERSVFSENI
jgi:hypothetical protein